MSVDFSASQGERYIEGACGLRMKIHIWVKELRSDRRTEDIA